MYYHNTKPHKPGSHEKATLDENKQIAIDNENI